MKGDKTIINRAGIFVVCLTTLALTGSAQTVPLSSATAAPAENLSGGRFVLQSGRKNTAQDQALVKLTELEIRAIISEQAKNNPQAVQTLADDPERRQKVLENLRVSLSLASEARKAGYASRDSIKMPLDLVRLELLASAYNDKLKKPGVTSTVDNGQPSPFSNISDAAAEKFLNAPANKASYDKDLKAFTAFIDEGQQEAGRPGMSAEQHDFIISQWKKAMYGAAKAKELRLETHDLEVQYRLQQALILARAYGDEVSDKTQPSAEELAAYLKENPKYDKKTYLARAEEVLQKIKAGGDFAQLADQYTEDPGNKSADGKNNGGFYDWHDRAGYVKEFSDAAWALKEGEVSGLVETQFGYHIIKLEGKRVTADTAGKGEEEVKVRHILIRTELPAGESPGDWLSLEDAAKKNLAEQKQKKALDDIMARNPISLPADFSMTPAKAETKTGGAKPAGTGARKPAAKAKRPAAKKAH